ncbi:LacI family DNA-binding transcriptional regulator [uncultured Leifsonia sp.]|uniref:LacI family DNA-binding transcriptional regulator n=1 Tax=uncultured Leifsonia sp. TaxID=340359 RepID=UPI0025E668D7|nr:LacI family DNA-binding transcriptional regulator [uncultured Leifsonia sp.]
MTTERVDGRAVPTLEAVAARAGVSRATVSRVVNGSPKVTPEVVEAVTRAIADLNYVPNRAARSLASRRTQVIALVVPESTAKVFADPFFASIVQGVALSLADTEYTLNMVISSETNPDKTRRYLMGGNVDGALVVSHHSGDHSYAQLGSTLPIVFGGRPVSESQHESYFVDVDNVAGSAGAAEHLIARGRRNIALITGPQDMPAGLDRFTGWRDALRAHGLDTSLVEYGDFSPYSGLEAMRRLLATGRPIDGLFAANDQMAAGAYSAIHEAGLDIPGDIAVVGFDDDNFGLTATPPLTTVHQPSIGLGETMARVLVRRLAGEPVDRVTLLPTELVVRQSS